MGFLSTATTITVTTKLTQAGRERMLKETNTIFSHFILGDSDANYRTSEPLPTGKIPTMSGDLGQDNAPKVGINSKVYISSGLTTKKLVEPSSSNITTEISKIGQMIVSGDSLNYVMIDRDDNTSDFTNLFKSLSLPILTTQISTFINVASTNGGWSDTAFSGFASDKVLVCAIDNDEYGELIDGKNIKYTLPIATGYTSGGAVTAITTYDIFSTFPRTTLVDTQLDNYYKDTSTLPKSLFGDAINCSYLVSDNIQRPNRDANKSWATGYDTYKPFSLGGKERITVGPTIPENNSFADRVIGVAYLDKGIIAFTDTEIVDNIAINFSGDPSTSAFTNTLGLYHYSADTYNVTIDSIDHIVVQNVLCIAGKSQFYRSQNDTIGINDDIRISEIGITDITGEILAIGKIDRQIIKKKNDYIVLNVEIVI